jgi:hypothetical protein
MGFNTKKKRYRTFLIVSISPSCLEYQTIDLNCFQIELMHRKMLLFNVSY